MIIFISNDQQSVLRCFFVPRIAVSHGGANGPALAAVGKIGDTTELSHE